MDINVNTGTTLSSGDNVAVEYFIGSTNATGSAPSLAASYYLSNPGPFAVMGTVVAAAQVAFTDTPAQLTFSTDRESELLFEYDVNNQTQPILTPGSTWTCSVFDGRTLIGSASTVVGGSTSGGVTNAFAACTGIYPNNAEGASANGHAYVNFPTTYNTGDVYTFIISH